MAEEQHQEASPPRAAATEAVVLVTGGTGFVAGWCIGLLLQRGYQVRATVRNFASQAKVRAAVAPLAGATERLSFAVADLNADDGWDDAMAGCRHVLHVASPLGAADAEAMIGAARDGTVRVLRAASKAGVERVVMTSAAATATPPLAGARGSLSDETVWYDPAERRVDAYRQSKRLAERAAWDAIASMRGATALTTILPGAVFGPVLSRDALGSVQVIDRLLQGRVPANPRLGFEIVDVRDLADLHIRAMLAPHAAGERILAVGEFLWMRQIAHILRDRLGTQAGKVPTRTLPDAVLWLMSLFDPSLRPMLPRLGRAHRHSADKALRLLGWQTRPAADTLADCAASLLPASAA
jgi:nucleoside-diphosphate-sugar epimerase